MASAPTREVARACVEHLRCELPSVRPRGVRSVFVNGSYARGDWLDGRSDLDIGLVTATGWESGFAEVKRLASEAIAGVGFDAHVTGGVDWNLIDRDALPRTTSQAVDSPYPYFNVFRFDLDAHCQVPWGNDFREWLPTVPPPAELARRFIRLRSQRVSQLEDSACGRRRALYAAYKTAVVLQLAHGEQTLDEFRIPALFKTHVPGFSEKARCARVIADYVQGSSVHSSATSRSDPLRSYSYIVVLYVFLLRLNETGSNTRWPITHSGG